MADCSYTFKGPEGNYLTVTGIHGLKAYLVDGGLEHLFPERKFPLKAVAAFSRPDVASWSEDRIKRLMSEFAYPGEGSTTKAYATWVSPQDFLNATVPASGVERLESEKRPLSVADLSAETQPIFLEISETADEGVFEITGHEGRHRMMGLRDAGITRVPVVLRVGRAERNAAQVEEPYFRAQDFGSLGKGKRGFDTYSMTPISYEFYEDLKADFGRSDAGTRFSKTTGDENVSVSQRKEGLYGNAGDRGNGSTIRSMDGLYTRDGMAIDAFRSVGDAEDHLSKAFGPGIKNLVSKGVLKLTQSYESWPEAAKRQLQGGEEAVYYQGKIYINLAATAKDRMAPVLLHELGEHFNLEVMLGTKEYAALQNQITARAKIKGSEAEKVWNQVKELYPEVKEGSKQFISEVIAKLGENNPRAPWYRRILARIKAFLVERGLGRGFIVGSMTEADMHELLLTSLRSASGRFATDEARLYGGEAVMASVPAWHGTPHTVDRFSTGRIGTGEGAQAFGYGLYFTSAKRIAEWYRDKLSQASDHRDFKILYKDANSSEPLTDVDIIGRAKQWLEDNTDAPQKDRNEVIDFIKQDVEESFIGTNLSAIVNARSLRPGTRLAEVLGVIQYKEQNKGNLYQVELAPEENELLDWDKPLSEQSDHVKNILGIDAAGRAYKEYDDFRQSMLAKYGGLGAMPEAEKSKYRALFEQYKNSQIDDNATGNVTGNEFYKRTTRRLGSDEAASAYLHSLGIRGIRYKAEGGKSDENNYVVFHEDDVLITGRFSRPAQAAGQVQESVKDFSAQLHGKLRKMSDKLFAQAYAFLSVRQMVEQSKEYLSNGEDYEHLMQERRAEVDRWLIKGDRVVSEYWKKLSKTTRHALAEVMHKSTLADVDASKEWTGKEVLKDEKGQPTNIVRVYTQSKLNKENQAWLDSIAGGKPDMVASASGRGYVDFLPSKHANADEVLAELRAREERQTRTRARNGWKDDNVDRKVQHAEAAAKFTQLPEQAKYVYTKANELHNAMFRARLAALEEQINNAILDVATRSKLNKELRQKMESQGLSWYYAPLSRHGDHWFYGKDADGNNWFRTFESRKERDEAMEEFKKTGKLMGSGTSIKERKDALGNEVSDTFIREINEAISRNVPSEEGVVLQDAIYQMYIDTLPDVSVRHSAMHRKGVLGFDEDAMRSFSNAMHHGASQLANMIYGRQMEGVLNDAEEALTIASSDNQVQMRKEEIEAGDLLAEHWDVLAQKGYIENELRRFKEPSDQEDMVDQEMRDLRFNGVPQELWAKMRELRNKFGRLDEDARIEALERHKERINRMLDIAKNIKHEDKHKMAAVISELRKTYKAMVATNSSDMDQIAAYVKQFNFIWTLGFSLSSGLINMLQTPIVAMPIAYGKYGMSKTLAKFGESRNEFMKAIKDGLHRDKNGQFTSRDEDGNISISVGLERKLKTLTFGTPEYTKIENELRALDVFKNSGDISRTQTFELIGIGQEGEEHGGKLQDFSKWAGWIFHAGERANREITLMAGYRLARESGMGHEESIAEARRMNNLAHGDYSSENAARIFRGWPSQIALQYKKYTQMQLYLWGSTALNAIRLIKDRNSQEGREAARTLGGLFVMQSAFAGAMGLPLMGATTAIINAIGGLFDDEDEPFDVEDEIRVWIAQNFGEKAATAVMKGALNALTPANIGDRLSLRNILFTEPMVELEGRDAATNYMASMFGPTGGTVKKLFEAGSLLSDGELLRGAEMATPKFIADLIKSWRYFDQDAQTLNHQKLKDMTAMENMFQLAGFSSSRLEELYAERSMVKQRESSIREYRQKLLNDAVRAEEEGKEVDIDAIQAFNEKYPMKAIVPQSIARSEKTRNKYREESEDRGYAIDPKLDFLYEEYDLDDSED